MLGKVYAEDGLAQGEAALRDIAAHPATSTHIATKLVRRFVNDDPPAALVATVAGVFSDVDGYQHVAVTVDDDPATEELTWQGRYLFFHVDEVEPLVGQGQAQ